MTNLTRMTTERDTDITAFNEMLKEVHQVTNKLVPAKIRFKVRKLLFKPDEMKSEQITSEIAAYAELCRIWMRLYYQGRVTLKIAQPWHNRARKRS